MKKVLKGKLFLILILIIESVLAFVINTKYIFTLDNIIKLSQSYGLYQSKFQKEDIYYSGKDIDPQYEYAPFKLGDTLKIIRIKDRFLGPFPFAFSLLSAVLLFLFSPIFLPLISILSTVFTFYLLDKYWDIDKKVNLFLFFCTPIIFLSLDYAEYTLFMLLNFWGLTLFVHNKNSQSRLILSGLVMGISVWFRLESVLFLCSLVTSYAIIYRKDKKMIYKFALPVLFYAIMVGCFVLFNYTNYENILGTRYIANQSGFLQSSFGKKVENALTLLFLGAGFKIGLFLYLPLFLFVGFYLFKHYKVIEEVYRVLLLTIVFFIVLVVSTTPNDGGHLNWGLRYFILTFMPFGILLDKFIQIRRSQTIKKFSYIFVVVLTVWSALLTVVQLAILKNITKTLKTVQNQYHEAGADVWIFSNKGYVLNSGLNILDKKMFVVTSKEEAKSLANLLSSKYKGKKIAYFTSDPKLQKMNTEKNTEKIEQEILTSLRENLVFQKQIKTKLFQIELFSTM